MKSREVAFLEGVKRGAPIALSYFPIAVAFGALALKAGLKIGEAVAMSLLVYAGASQFMAAGMILSGAGPIQIVTATFFLNLRHVMMSLAVNQKLGKLSGMWRACLAFWITDETFALLTDPRMDEEEMSQFTLAGLLFTAYMGWVSGTAAGSLSAGLLPPALGDLMSVGLYALFISLLLPRMRESISMVALVLASMTCSWGLHQVLSAGWAVVLTTALGAGLGIWLGEEKA